MRTIGRENISLHNRFIRSIVQNACHAKIPPQKARKVEGNGPRIANGYQRNCLQSLYGDVFPQSPRKCRSPVSRDRKFRDRPSPLGPLGKSRSVTCEETGTRIHEQESPTELHSLGSRPPIDVVSVEDGEEVEQFAGSLNVRSCSPVTAPIGVSVNVIGARKALSCSYSYNNFAETCQSSYELPDTRSLRSHLQKKLALEGVEISLDCANLLNNSLDVFLKRLIEPCIGIAGSQCRNPHILGKESNNQIPSGLNGVTVLQKIFIQPKYVNMLDFRVAMESNPCILGEDWSVQLEKICQ
ncbi:hypothetical protein Sango_0918100 [Sesamum angolense]|uniref:Uncharacterized protein n=1 Tax=Sesamum angolense TaxID=2727404 RepID=A0AAE1WYU2_9LAMI|nr:hypothetical protein Sango_0918100 [Sesamum angolense]